MNGDLHLGEFLPPALAAVAYAIAYRRRVCELRERSLPARWRRVSFLSGVVLVTIVQLPPFDGLADSVLAAHMVQHILIGDIASLLIVFGLTGPVIQPLLHMRASRAVRRLAHPVTALILWAVDLYAWHLPVLYQLAIRVNLVHALEHACMLWFGLLLWLSLIGPLPKPAWFNGGARLGYVVAVRTVGAVLANVFIWTQSLLYPIYRPTDVSRGLSPLSDQIVAGGIMMVEQVLLTTVLLGWLFYRFMREGEESQQLLDLAAQHGVRLPDGRAARAAAAGTSPFIRQRLLEVDAPTRPETGRQP